LKLEARFGNYKYNNFRHFRQSNYAFFHGVGKWNPFTEHNERNGIYFHALLRKGGLGLEFAVKVETGRF
jgi:hypothetical protein